MVTNCLPSNPKCPGHIRIGNSRVELDELYDGIPRFAGGRFHHLFTTYVLVLIGLSEGPFKCGAIQISL